MRKFSLNKYLKLIIKYYISTRITVNIKMRCYINWIVIFTNCKALFYCFINGPSCYIENDDEITVANELSVSFNIRSLIFRNRI